MSSVWDAACCTHLLEPRNDRAFWRDFHHRRGMAAATRLLRGPDRAGLAGLSGIQCWTRRKRRPVPLPCRHTGSGGCPGQDRGHQRAQRLCDQGVPWFAVNVERNQPQGGFIGVFDAETGQTRAILNEEHYLSDIRTAAAGTLAARVLAPPVVEVAGVLGAGVQAYWQPQALYRARPFKTLLIWARDAGKAEALQARLGEKLVGVEIRVTLSAEEVVRACDVLLTTTQAKEPIVRGAWLRPGQHITAIGADDVTKSELDAACLQRADRLIVDSLELAKQQGEVHRWLERGDIALEQVHGELGQVLAGTVAGRRTASEITVAKLVGLGVQDLVAAEVALDKLTSTS